MKFYSLFILSVIYLSSCDMSDQKLLNLEHPITKNGTIEGIFDIESGIHKYFGVPYAKPPLDELRWQAPQPLENWEGIKETKKFGNRPMQVKLWDDLNYRSEAMSEDCLYLNVWTPASTMGADLPVLVYIHGGGLMAGDGSELRYDGSSMAKEGIVVVTINYRLNIFGFLAHPELSAQSGYNGSGNYGHLDQVAALEWVRDNIAAFGGNLNKITIAGESAGSTSVSSLMVSPLSSKLISGAIGESGAAINPTLFPQSLEKAEKISLDFLATKGFKSFEDFRALSSDSIFNLYKNTPNLYFTPTIDNHFFLESLPETFNKKLQSQVPLLLGWNSAEIPGQAFMQGQAYNKENLIQKVNAAFGESAAEVLELYPHSDEEEIKLSATALASDGFIVYSTWKWFDLHRKNSEQPVYRYLYSKLRPPLVNPSENDAVLIGAPHACEIEYCLGNLDRIKSHAWTKEDYKVSETMLKYFANFIKTGDPNGDGLPTWTKANLSDSPSFMDINVECKEMKADHDTRYVFWDSYYGN